MSFYRTVVRKQFETIQKSFEIDFNKILLKIFSLKDYLDLNFNFIHFTTLCCLSRWLEICIARSRNIARTIDSSTQNRWIELTKDLKYSQKSYEFLSVSHSNEFMKLAALTIRRLAIHGFDYSHWILIVFDPIII